MSDILGNITGSVKAAASAVGVTTTLTATLGPQPAAPATSSTPAVPATGSQVTVPAAASSTPGLGPPYGGLSGTLVAASYDSNGAATAAQVYFPSIGYTATFLASTIAVKGS